MTYKYRHIDRLVERHEGGHGECDLCLLAGAIRRLQMRANAAELKLAMQKLPVPQHRSDCAVNNEPAMPAGECDCGGYPPPRDPEE